MREGSESRKMSYGSNVTPVGIDVLNFNGTGWIVRGREKGPNKRSSVN